MDDADRQAGRAALIVVGNNVASKIFQHCEPAVVARWMLDAHRDGGESALYSVFESAAEAFGEKTTKRALLLVLQNSEFSLRARRAH